MQGYAGCPQKDTTEQDTQTLSRKETFIRMVQGTVLQLWERDVPGAVGNEAQDRPSITVYLPPSDRATGAGVVVCPGGGYCFLAVDHEGQQIAEWLNAQGVAAFVLRYRIAPRYGHPAPLLDAQRAVRLVRSKAADWHLDPDRIGIWGFSAGGHLASSVSTHFDAGDPNAADPVERRSCRPDFAILGYPVISFTEAYRHPGSRDNLLGKDLSPELCDLFSNEKQVTSETPTTFLFHTDDDAGVLPENSVAYYLALRRAGVPAEMHIYAKGEHGVGLAQSDPFLSNWPALLANWLKVRAIIPD